MGNTPTCFKYPEGAGDWTPEETIGDTGDNQRGRRDGAGSEADNEARNHKIKQGTNPRWDNLITREITNTNIDFYILMDKQEGHKAGYSTGPTYFSRSSLPPPPEVGLCVRRKKPMSGLRGVIVPPLKLSGSFFFFSLSLFPPGKTNI